MSGQKSDHRPTLLNCKALSLLRRVNEQKDNNSAVAEMCDRGHNRHGSKRGEGRRVLCPFRGALGTRLIQCGLRRCLLPYQVASSSIQPFGHNTVGCHSPHRNISANYYLVVEMHTVTVRSDDAHYLLN